MIAESPGTLLPVIEVDDIAVKFTLLVFNQKFAGFAAVKFILSTWNVPVLPPVAIPAYKGSPTDLAVLAPRIFPLESFIDHIILVPS